MFEAEVHGGRREHAYRITCVGLGRILPDSSFEIGYL